MSDYEFDDYSQDERPLTDLDNLERAKELSNTLSVSDRGYLVKYILLNPQLSIDDIFRIYDCIFKSMSRGSKLPVYSKASIDRLKKLFSPPPTPALDCPKCHSPAIKNGRQGNKQRYLCKKCKYQFVK